MIRIIYIAFAVLSLASMVQGAEESPDQGAKGLGQPEIEIASLDGPLVPPPNAEVTGKPIYGRVGRHVAFVVRSGLKGVNLVVDGRAGPTVRTIDLGGAVYSADLSHIAYKAQALEDGAELIVVSSPDGSVSFPLNHSDREWHIHSSKGPWQDVVSVDTGRVLVTRDVGPSSKEEYQIRIHPEPDIALKVANGPDHLVLSPDGRRFAVSSSSLGTYIDGRKIDEMPSRVVFSPDSRRVYRKHTIMDHKAYLDERELPEQEECRNDLIAFSPDSRRFAHVGGKGNTYRVYVDDGSHDSYDEIKNLTFTDDSKSLRYLATYQGRSAWIVDGKTIEQSTANQVVLGPKAGSFALIDENTREMVLRDTRVKFRPSLNEVYYWSPGGKHIVGIDVSKRTAIMVDGTVQSPKGVVLLSAPVFEAEDRFTVLGRQGGMSPTYCIVVVKIVPASAGAKAAEADHDGVPNGRDPAFPRRTRPKEIDEPRVLGNQAGELSGTWRVELDRPIEGMLRDTLCFKEGKLLSDVVQKLGFVGPVEFASNPYVGFHRVFVKVSDPKNGQLILTGVFFATGSASGSFQRERPDVGRESIEFRVPPE